MEKAKKVMFVVGLGLCTAFALLQIELIALHTFTALIDNYVRGSLQYDSEYQVKFNHEVSVETEIIRTFKKEAKMALAISQAENGTRACDRVHLNKDGSKDIGVFQINTVHTPKGNLYDCKDNIKVAYAIYLKQGWSPWVAYKNGSYKKFLN